MQHWSFGFSEQSPGNELVNVRVKNRVYSEIGGLKLKVLMIPIFKEIKEDNVLLIDQFTYAQKQKFN